MKQVFALPILVGLAGLAALGTMLWVTAGSVERSPAQAAAPPSTPEERFAAEGASPSRDEAIARLEQEIRDLRRRLAALEARAEMSDRRPVDTPLTADDEKLRAILADVLAEEDELDRMEAERLAREEEARHQEEYEADLRFQIGMVIKSVSAEVELLPEEEDRLLDVLLDLEKRRREITESVDPLKTDPEEFQEQLDALQKWFERELENALGVELARRILEHFG